MTKKILKLTAYYKPENVAGTHLSNDLEEKLIESGYKIIIITPAPSRGIDSITKKKYKNLRHEYLNEGKIEIIRFKMFSEPRNILLRGIRYFLILFKQYYIAKSICDADIIYAESTPPILGLIIGKLKKKLKIPFVYVLQDIFPDSLFNTRIIKRKRIIWKIGRKIENYTYNSADKIIVISESFKTNIMSKGVPEEKIEIISNWIDTEKVKYIDRKNNYIFDKYSIDRSKFIVSYCGNLGLTQNLEMVLFAAKELSYIKDLKFVFVGEGKNKDNLISLSSKLKLDNILFLPFEPYKYISEVFSIGNLGLIVSKSGIGSNSVPSKLYTMMSASQPILASFDKNTELDNIIDKSKAGKHVVPDDLLCFIKELSELYNNQAELRNMGQCARKYVVNNCSKYNNTFLYLSLINSLTKT